MPRNWEETFRRWSGPSSNSEQEKQERAERMIREAIRQSRVLTGKQIEVFGQGSYRNNTNVREDSDVDICARCMDVCFAEFTETSGLTREAVGLVDAAYTYPQLNNDVEAALVAQFGRAGVTRGNKAFDVHENTARVDADVVACFEHRRYTGRDATGRPIYWSGAEFRPDVGGRIINWPHQHYERGVAKNKVTGERFKFLTRAMKRLRNEMADQGIAEARPIASYLIECLLYNVPNELFGSARYMDDIRQVLIHTFSHTRSDDECHQWLEVSELKWLFWSGQPWTRQAANAFIGAAWRHVGFT